MPTKVKQAAPPCGFIPVVSPLFTPQSVNLSAWLAEGMKVALPKTMGKSCDKHTAPGESRLPASQTHPVTYV